VGSVRPVHSWPWVGAAQDGDIVPQDEELDVLGSGHAAHQEDQSEHVREDQVQKPRRHAGIMSDQRSPLVSGPDPTSGTLQPWLDELDRQIVVTEDLAMLQVAEGLLPSLDSGDVAIARDRLHQPDLQDTPSY